MPILVYNVKQTWYCCFLICTRVVYAMIVVYNIFSNLSVKKASDY